MRKLIASINITLDGYLSGPDGELDWHFESWTREMGDALSVQLAKADTIVMGRVTYCAMSDYWSLKWRDPACSGEDFAFASMMNSYRKIVFSKTLRSATWNNSTLMKGKIKEEIASLKMKKGKDIILYGSTQLLGALIKLNLVDEYQLWLHPVVLGAGKKLFINCPGFKNEKKSLKMMKAEQFSSGIILLQYQVV